MNATQYHIEVTPLPVALGGGFVAKVPDLPGCMSDGETEVEARNNALDAINSWIEAASEMGRAIPNPCRILA